MAFGDKPTAPIKGSAAAFTEKLRQSAAEYKANGYRVQKLKLRHMDEIAATDFPAIKWAVRDFVPEGLTILGGPKSRGKSFIVLDWALAVARGGSALGSVPCEPGGVLYLALEDGERRIKIRALSIMQGQAMPHRLVVATEWPAMDQGGLSDIEAWICASENPRLVIVDVLAKVKGTPDRAKGVYDQDYATMTPFHKLARQYGISILIVHHTNKGVHDDPVMRISGTQGLPGACDTTIVLERAAGSMTGELHVRGRDVAERSVALQFDPETGCVTLLGPAKDYRKSEERKEIVKLLNNTVDPLNPAEIAAALAKKPNNIRYLLHKMKEAGEVWRLPNGKYCANKGT